MYHVKKNGALNRVRKGSTHKSGNVGCPMVKEKESSRYFRKCNPSGLEKVNVYLQQLGFHSFILNSAAIIFDFHCMRSYFDLHILHNYVDVI